VPCVYGYGLRRCALPSSFAARSFHRWAIASSDAFTSGDEVARAASRHSAAYCLYSAAVVMDANAHGCPRFYSLTPVPISVRLMRLREPASQRLSSLQLRRSMPSARVKNCIHTRNQLSTFSKALCRACR